MDQYSPPNILFYSKHCPHCKKFAELLFKLPQVNDKFIKISVDVRNQRLPSFVKSVPTIVIHDQGERKVLTDSNVFSWINQYLEDSSKVELVPYDQGAMSSSLSDNFSFIGDDAGKESEHTFAWMDKLQDTRIGLVADSEGGPTTNSQHTKIKDSQLERYMAERDKGIPRQQRPTQNIDFTQLYEQDQGGGPDKSVINQLQSFRKKQVRRGAPPRQGPNFQSQSFKADWAPQSQRGGIVRNFGGNSRQAAKQRELDSRMKQLHSQRDRDNGIFQQKQHGEYIPLSFNQQQQQMRRQQLQQQRRRQQQNSRNSGHSGHSGHSVQGRRAPANFRPRIL
jgi:thiol-disulfide isomerase/thioredoxin